MFMYADDILALIADSLDSLPLLLECINALEIIRLYWHKLEAMPLHVMPCHNPYLKPFHFKWMPSCMKYLGIQLNPNLDEIMLSNMEPLLQKIKRNLEKRGKWKLYRGTLM